MADIADLAQINEEAERNAAIEAHKPKMPPYQKKQRGMIVCMDCECTLSNARLNANPQAVRCVHCQRDLEAKRKHVRVS